MKFCMLKLILIATITFFMRAQIGTLVNSAALPVTICDNAYGVQMQRTLEALKNYTKVDLLPVAEQYMIMLKQHQDLDYAIRQMERNVFDTTIVAMLRRPLEEYARCKTNIRSGTETRTRDL